MKKNVNTKLGERHGISKRVHAGGTKIPKYLLLVKLVRMLVLIANYIFIIDLQMHSILNMYHMFPHGSLCIFPIDWAIRA